MGDIALIITSLTGLIAALAAGIAAILTARVRANLNDLHGDVKKTAVVAEKTYKLSNSAMAAQLKISWLALAGRAEVTKDHHDLSAAEEAKKLYEIHMVRQDAADAARE